MKRPRLKRNRPAAYISVADFPMDEFLKHCPLPPEYKHLEAGIRGPVGQTVMTAMTTCYAEGFSPAQLEDVAAKVVEFYGRSHHRCNACFAWTDDFMAGAIVTNGRFNITVVCQTCSRLITQGRGTEQMRRNVQAFVNGGAK